MIEIKKQADGLNESRIRRFLAMARKAVRLRGDICLLLTSNREMKRLNRHFRGQDKPTDVLSFPAPGEIVETFAGDLAISIDIASANARELGHSVEDEVRVLILHGVLHLAGYDHETDQGEMARKELRLRNQLGLPSTLIARSQNQSAMPSKSRSNGRRAAVKKNR